MWDQMTKKVTDTRKFEGIAVKVAADSVVKAGQRNEAGKK
jgi:hypothetical protein